ncbi:MAG: hypothetical protein NUV77_13715, partial [Thermoguttaceae bacterium]|nr:hypothetical protein [Thermoguttaceae bacterium]
HPIEIPFHRLPKEGQWQSTIKAIPNEPGFSDFLVRASSNRNVELESDFLIRVGPDYSPTFTKPPIPDSTDSTHKPPND